MLRFWKGSPIGAGTVGVLPGAFNPPTVGHEAVAAAARDQFDLGQVVFLVPEVFPHKSYEGASLEDRIAMLCAAAGQEAAYAVASSREGLFIDIARQVRERYGDGIEICLICGRDAAERIVGWDYGDGPPLRDQLKEFRLLVASREGEYVPPARYASRIQRVELAASFDEVSSSSVREAVALGSAWRRWVSERVAAEIDRRGLYQARE
jgi:nicotinate (nicotinamide) nucleotide adenylyltransferase